MKKHLFLVAISAILMLGFTQCNHKPKEVPAPSDPKEELAKLLERTADRMKENLPLRINATTEILDLSAIDGHILEYTYKGISLSATQFDSVAFKNQNENSLKQTLVTNAETKTMIDKGATLSYIYIDKDGEYLCKMVFTPEDLK